MSQILPIKEIRNSFQKIHKVICNSIRYAAHELDYEIIPDSLMNKEPINDDYYISLGNFERRCENYFGRRWKAIQNL